MEIFLSIVILILGLLIDHWAAKKFCDIAEEKGYNAKELNVYRWYFIFPAIGYAYVIALPYRKQYEEVSAYLKKDEPEVEDKDSWTCKKCGEKNPKTRMTCQKCDTYKNAHL